MIYIIAIVAITSVVLTIVITSRQKTPRYFVWSLLIIQFLEIQLMNTTLITVPRIGFLITIFVLLVRYKFTVKALNNKIIFFSLIWWFFYTLSISWSTKPSLSIDILISGLSLLTLTTIMAYSVYRFGNVNIFFEGYVIVSLISGFITLGQFFDFIPANLQLNDMVITASRMGGLKVNPNMNSFQLGLGSIPILLNLSRPKQDRVLIKSRLANVITLGILSLAILSTQSRTGVIAFLLVVMLTLLLSSLFQEQKLATIGALLTLVVVAFAIFQTQSPLMNQLSSRFENISQDQMSGRILLFNFAWDSFLENPIIGYGAGTFPLLIEPTLGGFIEAHNTYLELLVEVGIVGALFFILIIIRIIMCLGLMWKSKSYYISTTFIGMFALIFIFMFSGSLILDKNMWIVLGMLSGAVKLGGRLVDQR